MKFLVACLGICLVLLTGGMLYSDIARIPETPKTIQPPSYKVYYEYDIYNGDTVAVDTIYVPIN